MPKQVKVKVIKESRTGKNTHFDVGGKPKTRGQFADEIEKGKHPDYHIVRINGERIPRSNPDGNTDNNLGWVWLRTESNIWAPRSIYKT